MRLMCLCCTIDGSSDLLHLFPYLSHISSGFRMHATKGFKFCGGFFDILAETGDFALYSNRSPLDINDLIVG